jgi:hypothetical protein
MTTAADWFSRSALTPRDGDACRRPSLEASAGHPARAASGPAFLAYPNFDVYLEWNQSFIYTTSAAYFAAQARRRAARCNARQSPEARPFRQPACSDLQTQACQALGHDVGEVDGILGAGTRVRRSQTEQLRLGLPADGWPTPQLLGQI